MIRQLEIENFQSHKHTVIDFKDGVNAIVGLSDSGKSAALRALIWVTTNKPSGDEFMSWWGGAAKVTLTLDNGQTVTRYRKDTDNNKYSIDEGELTEQIFKAFGQGVPPEIKTVLNLNDINIQKQMDIPFLIGSSSGEVAQVLNRVVNLDVIDTAVSSIRKQKLNADQDLRSEQNRLEGLQEERTKFDYLENMKAELNLLSDENAGLDEKKAALLEIRVLCSGMRALLSSIDAYEKVLAAESDVIAVTELKNQWKECDGEIDRLASVMNKYEQIDISITKMPDYEGAAVLIDSIIEAGSALKALKNEVGVIDTVLDHIDVGVTKFESLEKQITLDETELNEQMPDVCPLCGK